MESISQVRQLLSACWCLLSTAVWPGGTRGGREMNLATNGPELKFTADTLNTTTIMRTFQIEFLQCYNYMSYSATILTVQLYYYSTESCELCM